ncbi:hypothetical protein VE00_11013 [Pseudogymnoascus sp. WSF 3629]|nr:hypothetical protein VE00_11013 [Pseudogymnoascus sp. WSF 3629]
MSDNTNSSDTTTKPQNGSGYQRNPNISRDAPLINSKRIGESKVIATRAKVESAKLIRYLEAMQAMAKSANSKVIFLPRLANVAS